ncbi:pirin [Sinorhizobium sojae CCBAU 05684]|uniref:Pirin n=2 Tax=Sinorhizobium sojae TaxID=716925 RepID=A0A249P981_9HYPH|nr:pirin [Sinorhizobium sojae CCBAU 05684]
MRNAIHSALAAALVAVAVIGGASAAFAGGSYYEGISPSPLYTGRAAKSGGETVRHNANGTIDRTATGSVYGYARQPKMIPGGEGEYYQGLSR